MSVVVQSGKSAVGLPVTSAWPESTATHSVVEGQETPPTYPAELIGVRNQPGFSPAGSVEVTAKPPRSTATHNDAETHDTPSNGLPSMWVSCQVGLAAAGLVETTTLPDWSTAAQKDADGQEIAISGAWSSMRRLFQTG